MLKPLWYILENLRFVLQRRRVLVKIFHPSPSTDIMKSPARGTIAASLQWNGGKILLKLTNLTRYPACALEYFRIFLKD